MKSSEATLSIWRDTAEPPDFPPLSADAAADVCVVGAGIAGLTTAYLLAREGRRVVLLERGGIAAGESGQTSAHLAYAMDDYYHAIERMHGAAGARLAFESHRSAVERIGRIAGEEGIDCEYQRVDGYLFLAAGTDPKLLDDELAAAARAGFSGIERLPRIPTDLWDSGPCLRFPEQAQFHPLRYLSGLARAAAGAGVRIYTGTEVAEAPTGGSSIDLRTRTGSVVSAGSVVLATNYPISRWLGIVPKLASYRTYIVGLRLPAGAVPRWLYWDTGDPYHYVRVATGRREDEEILIVGGEDHKTGQEEDPFPRFATLEAWTRERFPVAGEVVYRWSGQVQEPADAMGFIGPQPREENLYVITGDSGQGLTHGTLGAMLVTELIAGRRHPWLDLYDPSRLALGAPVELARENLNAVAQFRDYIIRRDAGSRDEVARGEGAVVRDRLRPVAVYRDESGELHERSAVCTHMECIVRWNPVEKSWDCPCHGSRFSPVGEVLTGPATQPLKPVEGGVE
jgi:glycine/D-amino acid oxidase-like deaminating enzyme/nitrite reductase/ring-hydroxylating ferredoxin subunit